ncbi:hypothetical protein RDV64_19135 [Acuticoccus sp. MNP-M23]|uniref:hypothetical protein n=1 Tax=Acuticoccus sp. MNP-M23 TaxID=3072793 RepID=UPI0028150F2C|nr:hypothetical protein [Acuticoccus sp. MNP-M23]WMS42159.1 hypothetical protein RDV64_19135 [Acuticoccus sp. MNP-M23]
MRVVAAIAREEPWSVRSRLLAYAAYAQRAGIETVVMPLTSTGIEGFLSQDAFAPAPDGAITDIAAFRPGRDDLVVFSSPSVHHIVTARYGPLTPRFLHLIQSATVASTEGKGAYGYRLLAKPMKRIALDETFARRIALIGGAVEMDVIAPAFALDPFVSRPQRHEIFAAAVHAADADTAARTLDQLNAQGAEISVRIIEATTTPDARAAAYAASTVALIDPRYDEGLSQPAFEAVAAGCALIMPACEALTTLPPGVAPLKTVPMDSAVLLGDAINSIRREESALLNARISGQAALLAHVRGAKENARVTDTLTSAMAVA